MRTFFPASLSAHPSVSDPRPRRLSTPLLTPFDSTPTFARTDPRPSAYALKHFCDVDADKRYQLADWRRRPLSREMLEYARGDTHHLLYVHDRMKQELRALTEGLKAKAKAAAGFRFSGGFDGGPFGVTAARLPSRGAGPQPRRVPDAVQTPAARALRVEGRVQ